MLPEQCASRLRLAAHGAGATAEEMVEFEVTELQHEIAIGTINMAVAQGKLGANTTLCICALLARSLCWLAHWIGSVTLLARALCWLSYSVGSVTLLVLLP